MAAFENVSNFVLTRLFFPRKIIIDKPGIIINKLMQKYGGKNSQHRSVFFFEDIMSNLQNESIRKLGVDGAKIFWYKTGKEVATRYLILSNAKKMPYFLQKVIIEYVLEGFSTAGQTFATTVSFDLGKKSLVCKGKNNIVCRKTGVGDFSSGLISGVVSYFLGENIEAEAHCSCPDCMIVASPEISKKCKLDINTLVKDKNCYYLNFPSSLSDMKKGTSFKDILRFKKIRTDEHSKFLFSDNALILGEIGFFYVICDNYISAVSKKSLESVLLRSSKKLAADILEKNSTEKKKIEATFNMLSAFGYGVFDYKRTKDSLVVISKWTPYYNNEFFVLIFIINGFLDVATASSWECISQNFDKHKSTLCLKFKKSK